MRISSRTPEGWNGFCRVCRHQIIIDPSLPSGDATCPHCGCLVWLHIEPVSQFAQPSLAFRAGELIRCVSCALKSFAAITKACSAAAVAALLIAVIVGVAIVTRDMVAVFMIIGPCATGSAILYGRDRYRTSGASGNRN